MAPTVPGETTPLLNHPLTTTTLRRPVKILANICLAGIFALALVLLIINEGSEPQAQVNDIHQEKSTSSILSRGVSQGCSEKTFREGDQGNEAYSWTNATLSWQRTAFHFQPVENWMNDPNGPLFHMGWYHLFYQYNPDAAIWGNITWGHAVSKDLIHWLYLPYALEPDSWYDINGVWTGSATLLPDGQIIMLYTGDTDNLVQVQNLAYPSNLSDPLLLKWEKYSENPVLVPPPGIGLLDFRDPTTAWLGPDGKWLITIGSKVNRTGISLVYKTDNFTSYELLDGYLHSVPGTGMWECIDFYPVSTVKSYGLDTSTNGPNVKHVMKASMDDDRHDYYAIGTYDPLTNKWIPDNPELDVGIGLRYDYGVYYASKTFYDQNKKRRILWGWIGETDSADDDILKGWSSVQTIPRTIVFDKKTGTNILQWPVEEVESLRTTKTKFKKVKLAPGAIVPLKLNSTSQLDIVATFEVDDDFVEDTSEIDANYTCSASGGAVSRGILGPFGIAVIADGTLSELTPVYFYIAKDIHGKAQTHFCTDQLRSTLASSVGKQVYGSNVFVKEEEDYSMRLLVDHSILESFAQGGRTVITSRIYPTKAIDGEAQVFLFNNATGLSVTATIKVWTMASADIHNFPLNQL